MTTNASTDATDALAALVRSVLDTPGATAPRVRAAALAGDRLPEPIESYLKKVRNGSYQVTDRDITALLSAGYSEDSVFEVTLAAAIGAAIRRLDAAKDLMRVAS